MTYRLGCKDHDAGRAALLPRAPVGLTLPPASVPPPQWQPEMYDNNVNPTCVAIALAHALRGWSWKHVGADIAVPLAAVDAIYCAATGTDPANIAASDGADPLDLVDEAEAKGWDIGQQVPLGPDIGIGDASVEHIKAQIEQYGASMLAVTLYESDMEEFDAGRVWQDQPHGDPIGGHMICAGWYQLGVIGVATWGKWQPATPDWLRARLRLVLAAGWRQVMPTADQAAYEALWGSA